MTTHLTSQECVTALDRELSMDRLAHLDACASCQVEVAALRALVAEVGQSGDVPEPSPLFWDHFQARVQAAVATEMESPARASWWAWAGSARAVLAAVAAVAVVAVAVSRYPREVASPEGRALVAGSGAGSAVAVDGPAALQAAEWEFVTGMMGELEQDDARQVMAPSRHAMDSAFETLSETERDAFIRLLTAEMVAGTE